MNEPTPRTDAVVIVSDGADGWGQMTRADFARQLERELAAAQGRIKALEAQVERSSDCLMWLTANSSEEQLRALNKWLDARAALAQGK